MKTPELKMVVLAAVVSMTTISCNNSTKEKEEHLTEAKEKVADAKEDLAKSTQDSISTFNKYKESIEKKLEANENRIATLKATNSSKDKSTQAMYIKQLDKLEMKNKDLKHKIEDYKEGPEQKWELFTINFNKDVDDLGKSISNMAERNMKK